MLEILAKRHKYWISIARAFGVENYAEDVIQDMYLKVSSINLCTSKNYNSYVICVIRSLCMDFHKRNNRTTELKTYNLQDNITADMGILVKDIENALNCLTLEERGVFEVINIDKISMCELERQTGINKTKIHRINKKAKIKLWKRI